MSKIAVVYWSGTGNTEIMAKEICEGIKVAGGECDLYHSDDFNSSLASSYEIFAFGCPSMGAEELEGDSFLPMYEDVEDTLKGKKVALFGSYGWGNCEWMDDWKARVVENGSELLTTLTVHEEPSNEDIEKCRKLGQELV